MKKIDYCSLTCSIQYLLFLFALNAVSEQESIRCKPSKEVTRLNVTYICPRLNDFCLHKSKLTTASGILNPCTL